MAEGAAGDAGVWTVEGAAGWVVEVASGCAITPVTLVGVAAEELVA